MSESRVRLFVAIPLSADLQSVCGQAAAGLHGGWDTSLKFVEAGHFHVTLVFIGERDLSEVVPLGETLLAAAAEVPPFSARIGDGAAIPSREPRTLVVDLYRNESLNVLHTTVAHALHERHRVPLERRIFRPHITLARVKRPPLNAQLRDRLHWLHLDHELVVDRIELVQSNLSASGPRYRTLLSVPLGG
ncbi:MAG: RNA 2',3'-cyclic phosphodiesterase [Fimbriimonadales bacterium]